MEVDQVLEEMRIAQPRHHVAGLFLGALGFVAISVWMIGRGTPAGWPGAILFGVTLPVWQAMIWGPNAVVFNRDQLIIQTAFRTYRYDWQNITDLRIREHRHGFALNRFVAFHLADPPRIAVGLSRLTASGHGTLPPVGVDVEELLEIAERYWRHACRHPQ